MKKRFIFSREVLDKIRETARNAAEYSAAMDHAVLYGLGEIGSAKEYAAIEGLIDKEDGILNKTRATPEDYKYVVDYLNKKCGTNFRCGASKTRDLISTRFAEGYNRDDFVSVIDYKCAEWWGNERMRGYLRPETLFSNKFGGYLEQMRMAKNADSQTSFDTDEFYQAALERAYGGVG